jgi:hypothetical protein
MADLKTVSLPWRRPRERSAPAAQSAVIATGAIHPGEFSGVPGPGERLPEAERLTACAMAEIAK